MNAWTLANKGKKANKENLAQWVSLALKRASKIEKCTKGFKAHRIWPPNVDSMTTEMGLSTQYNQGAPISPSTSGMARKAPLAPYPLADFHVHKILEENDT